MASPLSKGGRRASLIKHFHALLRLISMSFKNKTQVSGGKKPLRVPEPHSGQTPFAAWFQPCILMTRSVTELGISICAIHIITPEKKHQ